MNPPKPLFDGLILYDPDLNDLDKRQRAFEELVIALRSQLVDGKHVHIDTEPMIQAYLRIEDLLTGPCDCEAKSGYIHEIYPGGQPPHRATKAECERSKAWFGVTEENR